MSTNYIAYYRVSTQKQGASGLGLEAQRDAVQRFVAATHGEIESEFMETETGKGADALAARPQLRAALEACRKKGATLIIAKLDRLARNVAFVAGLMESKVRFVAADMPEANDLTLHIMAAFAEHEAKRISERTKDALRAAKARGVKLGAKGAANLSSNVEQRVRAADEFAEGLRGLVCGLVAARYSQRGIVAELNRHGIAAPRGGSWTLFQVQRLLKRLAVSVPAPPLAV